jgi:hypothetical protein
MRDVRVKQSAGTSYAMGTYLKRYVAGDQEFGTCKHVRLHIPYSVLYRMHHRTRYDRNKFIFYNRSVLCDALEKEIDHGKYRGCCI